MPTPEALKQATALVRLYRSPGEGGIKQNLEDRIAVLLDAFASRRVAEHEAKDSGAAKLIREAADLIKSGEQPYAVGYQAGIAEKDAEIAALRDVLETIKSRAFYHMVQFADQRGDRKVLGQIKEVAIEALRAPPDHTIPSNKVED